MAKHFQRRRLANLKGLSLVAGTTVLALSVIVPVRAETVTQSRFPAQTNDEIQAFKNEARGLTKDVQSFTSHLGSFVGGDLFGNMTQIVQQTVGAVKVPDLGQVVSQIMHGSLPSDYQLSAKVENNLPNSYAIRQDAAKQSERVGAIETAQTQTLSKTAQDNTRARLQLSSDADAQSRGKAEDSQQSDTSQRILRNISNQQQALADIAHLQMQEASQARQDRALQLTLSAQAAEELNAANTRERQTAIASGNAAAAQGAMLTMPGGAVLGQPAR